MSGIPEAVAAVLGCIRDGQAEAELKARNARTQLDPRTNAGGVGISNRGGGGSVSLGMSNRGYGGSGGIGASNKGYGGVGSSKEEDLETLMMLAAGSGKLDMFDAVLTAMRQKLKNEHEVCLVPETHGCLSMSRLLLVLCVSNSWRIWACVVSVALSKVIFSPLPSAKGGTKAKFCFLANMSF